MLYITHYHRLFSTRMNTRKKYFRRHRDLYNTILRWDKTIEPKIKYQIWLIYYIKKTYKYTNIPDTKEKSFLTRARKFSANLKINRNIQQIEPEKVKIFGIATHSIRRIMIQHKTEYRGHIFNNESAFNRCPVEKSGRHESDERRKNLSYPSRIFPTGT